MPKWRKYRSARFFLFSLKFDALIEKGSSLHLVIKCFEDDVNVQRWKRERNGTACVFFLDNLHMLSYLGNSYNYALESSSLRSLLSRLCRVLFLTSVIVAKNELIRRISTSRVHRWGKREWRQVNRPNHQTRSAPIRSSTMKDTCCACNQQQVLKRMPTTSERRRISTGEEKQTGEISHGKLT